MSAQKLINEISLHALHLVSVLKLILIASQIMWITNKTLQSTHNSISVHFVTPFFDTMIMIISHTYYMYMWTIEGKFGFCGMRSPK